MHIMGAFTPLLLVGCLSYSTRQIDVMSTLDLCEQQTFYRVNLSEATREQIRSELQRRKTDCSSEQAAIQARRAEDLYDRTYRTQSP
jgi:hypothetical protein